MKSLWSCSLLMVLLVYWANARQVRFSRARINNPQEARQEDPDNFLGQTVSPPKVRCYGLARRTRTRTIQVPILYNRLTGQSSRIPNHIFSLDGAIIDQMEAQGWEVRVKVMALPEPVYQRLPVCCPWEANCQQGQGMNSDPRADVPRGPCANGRELVLKNGVQTCECPPGSRGAWCHIPDLVSGTQSPKVMPSGPIIPYGSPRDNPSYVPAMVQELAKVAQLWKLKMMHNKALMSSMAQGYGSPMTSYAPNLPASYNSPMLSPNDHLVNSISQQWGSSANLTPRQMLKMKMAMLADWYIAQYGQMPPSVTGPVKGHQGTYNPYSDVNSQGFPNPHVVALANHLRQDPRLNDRNGPRAMTPWGLDPFDRQPQVKALGGTPGGRSLKERQLMALAFYKYIQNIQRRTGFDGMKGMADLPNSIPGLPMSGNGVPQGPTIDALEPPMAVPPQVIHDAIEPPTDFHAIDLENQPSSTTNDVPTLVEDKLASIVPLTPAKEPMRDAPIDDVQPHPGPMNGQLPPRMPGGPGMPQPPTPQEIQKMEECRVHLEPKIDECLSSTGHDLTLQQFMNPEFMETARSVCTDSQSVGQCIMTHDSVCGQGDDVIVTRKMIDSVLHMMGMVCQEIMNGAPQNIPQQGMPGIAPHVLHSRPSPPMAQPPVITGSDLPAIPSMPETETRSPLVSSEPVDPTPSSDNTMPHPEPETKKTTSKFGHHVTEDTPAQAASQSDNGHHGKEPVSTGLLFMGFPLWLVLTVSSALLLLLLLATITLCVCIRRRRNRKEAELQKEVMRLPQPLDAKFYTIAVPPPTYPGTVAVKQNDDGLSLPPLEMGDNGETVSISLADDNEEGDNASIQKPPVSDADADDESDDKEDKSNKKKKEKKEKK